MALADLRARARAYAGAAPDRGRDLAGDSNTRAGFAGIVAHREIDPEERAAIEAEPALPPIGTAARDLADAKQAAMVAGLLASSLRRPPSWWNELPQNPPPGSVCSCCGRRDWWTRDRRGWCCAVCHPPVSEHFPERLIRVTT